ncbi:MAG TPA: hypothetical protein VJP88_07920 [Caulobacteraceae bacterium]|nr:hypothetical protein [Caulobacteraceae bacterium]
MSGRIEFQGASGRVYSFFRSDEPAAARPIGVTYVIAAREAGAWLVMAVGHTPNLAERSWASELAQARAIHPAAELLVRLNVSRAIREEEAADLAHLVSPGGDRAAAGG